MGFKADWMHGRQDPPSFARESCSTCGYTELRKVKSQTKDGKTWLVRLCPECDRARCLHCRALVPQRARWCPECYRSLGVRPGESVFDSTGSSVERVWLPRTVPGS